MRILIVHNLLWAHYKSAVFQALQQLVDQQPNVSMLVLQIARNERSRAGLETEDSESTPTYSYNYKLLFDRYLEEVSLFERIRALYLHAKAYRPDVINLTGYYDPAQLLLLFWAKVNGIRVIMQNESTAADHERGGWKERFKRIIFKQCDGFFCFGSLSARYVTEFGVSPDKVLLKKNAVDNPTLQTVYEKAIQQRTNQQQQLGLRPHNFIFVGRLIEFKNLPVLITAFGEALSQSHNGNQWGLVLLGDGIEHDSLVDQVTSLELTDPVKFLPGRPWFKVPELLALSDVLVLPSRSEPWGLVVNEAMACGLPVIVSNRCGCVADLVRDGQNGFIFDPNHSIQLIKRLVEFMDNNVDMRQMSTASKQLIAPYSPGAVAREMLQGFSKITT